MSVHFCGDDNTAELVLRTIISVKQLSIYGAVADMCDELACRISGRPDRTGELVAQDNPEIMVIPTELSTTNKSPRTGDDVQGNLLQNYEQKFAKSSIDQTVLECRYHEDRGEETVFHDPRRCGTGQTGRLMSRVYCTSRHRSIQSKRMDPWEHEDRSSLEVAVSHHQGRCGNRDHDRIPIWCWNQFLGSDREWNKYVTELTEETQDDHIGYVGECTGKPLAKARPKQTSMATTSSSTATLPHHLRVWIEGGTRSVRQELFRSVKKKDKSGCFDTILQYFEKKTEQSNSESWHRCFVQNLRLLTLSYLQKRRRTKEETRVLCGSTLC